MLSKTANNLYWMARYLERAGTTARLLEVGARNSLLPNLTGGYRNEWDAVLSTLGLAEDFAARGLEVNQKSIETYLFFDRDNPASVTSCLERARENGRIVRTALTQQVWDALNSAFQELKALERRAKTIREVTNLTEWATRTVALLRGAIMATQLRDDGYRFMNLGHYLELADNTARLLDVKYYVLLPKADYVGTGIDNAQWATVLRAVSALRAFNWAYGQEMTPARIAHFLILNRQSPRSLLTAVTGASENLEALAKGYGHHTPAQARARVMVSQLIETSIDEIIAEGLHEFLTRFIRDVQSVGQSIHEVYLGGAWE
jgi:uncharacterized alpha-E superfamily protein